MGRASRLAPGAPRRGADVDLRNDAHRRFDYTATAFAKPLRLIFAALYRPRREVIRETAGTPYVLRRIRYTGEIVDLAETHVLSARHATESPSLARRIRVRSTGRIHGYIAFVLGALLVALLLFGVPR